MVRTRSASVELDELVDGPGLGVGVLEHPQQVLEQHHLAGHADGSRVVVVGGAVGPGGGPLDELAEEGVAEDGGADEVAATGLADVDGVEVGWGDGGGGGGGAAVVGDGGDVAAAASAAAGGGAVAAGAAEGVPLLEDGLELCELATFGHGGRER